MSIKRFNFMMNPSATRVQQTCFIVIDAIQHLRKEDHIVALAVLWLLVCERFGVKHEQVLSCANNILSETLDNDHRIQLKALKEYMKNELN